MSLYLSQLCPADCELTPGVRWPDAFGIVLDEIEGADDIRVKMQNWWIRWGSIAKVLSLVVRARQDEKARVMALQREMAQLSVTRKREKERLEELEREVSVLKGTVYTREGSNESFVSKQCVDWSLNCLHSLADSEISIV